MRTVVAALALLCCFATAVPAADRCADGGNPRPDEGGIGGTGVRPPDPGDDSGIGGTGVIGTITGFASICVAGREVHYAADTPVQVDGAAATIADLAVGQVVEVLADGTGNELRAREIAVRHVVKGPVIEGGDLLDVAGQRVQVSEGTRVEGGEIAPGAWVEVSGMRRSDGVVVASRVTRVQDGTMAAVTGTVRADGTVAGTPVALPEGVRPAVGEDVRVAGTWRDGTLHASVVDRLARVPFAGRAARIEIEGFSHVTTAGQARVGQYDVSAGAAPLPDGRVRVEGRLRDGVVLLEQMQPMMELPLRALHPDGGRSGPPPGRPNDARGRAGPPPRPEMRGGPDRPAVPERPERPDRPDVPRVERPPRPPERPPRVDRPPR